MSTQVTYKGNTIANFTNDTKTLKTAGKYMEDDVTITEVIAGQGNVWQDEDGYVHLDDESGLDFQAKSVNPTESSQTVRPDAGYTALSQVTVGAISSTYVGSGITRRDGDDSNFTIISKTYVDPGKINARLKAPEGYYASNAFKTTQFGITSITDLPIQTSTTITPTTLEQTAVSANTWVTGDVKVSAMVPGSATTPATTITTNPTFTIVSSTGKLTASYTGSSNVTPTIDAGYITAGTAGKITTTGTSTYTLATQAAQTITPTETQQTIASYRWLTGTQTIAAISSNYVGTGISRKSATDLTASGSVVTVPIGYYSSQVTKSISGGQAFTPAVTITTNPTFTFTSSTGKLTAAYTGSSNVTPTVTAGYIAAGTSGKVTTTGTSTYTLTTQAATTYNVSTADQTIASYRWLTGAQTIKSVVTSNLIASNIKSGVTVTVGDANNASRITQISGTYAPTLISKTVTPTEDTQVITADTFITTQTGYVNIVDGFSYSAINLQVGTAYSIHIIFEDQDTGAGTYDVWYDVVRDTTNYILAGRPVGSSLVYITPTYAWIESNVGDPHGYLTFTIYQKEEADGLSQVTVNPIPSKYDIYKSIANRQTIYSSASGISDFCNSFSLISSYQFAGVKWGNGLFNFDNVESIESYAFGYPSVSDIVINPSERTSMTFNNCNMVGAGAFINYNSLKEISMLSCVAIGQYAFASCYNLTTVSFPSCTNIGDHAFVYCSSLTTISFPVCTNIDSYAFSTCKSLKTASFPSCTSIGSHAFDYCPSLTTISFPVCTNIGSYAFQNCTSLKTASFSVCTNIDDHAFYSCKSLTTISFSVCTNIGSYAFASCSSLTTAYFPSCTTINTYAFTNCARLTTASFPECVVVSYGAFANCSNLSMVSFPKLSIIDNYGFQKCGLTNITLPACTYISFQAFISCYNLLSLYLIGSSICYLSASAFHSTPISNYTTSTGGVYGSIFVPASLYDSYKITTNWSLFASRFVSLTDAQINNVLNYGRHDP